MRTLHFGLLRTTVCYFLVATLIVAFSFSCRKSNHADVVIDPKPVIAYKQKVISVAEDMPMTPVKPDSTGGPITGYSVSPSLPKGFALNKANGEISGTPSDTLAPTKFVVMASGPGGTGTDTITLLVGTVGFNYGATGIFTLEKGTVLSTPISPVILAGTFRQFLISSPFPDSLTFKTGNLTFSPATGQISGSATKLTSTTEIPVAATFAVLGISTSGKAATAMVTIIVNDKK